jgi:hypothetical protein
MLRHRVRMHFDLREALGEALGMDLEVALGG